MSVKITCINKDNGHHEDPHLAIAYFGWLNEVSGEVGRCSLIKMVEFIEKGGAAYVKDLFGNVAYLVVRRSIHGNKFVKTETDGKETNNLLSLLECR
jgi:hypothetical protein